MIFHENDKSELGEIVNIFCRTKFLVIGLDEIESIKSSFL